MNQEEFKTSVRDWIKAELPDLEETEPTTGTHYFYSIPNWVNQQALANYYANYANQGTQQQLAAYNAQGMQRPVQGPEPRIESGAWTGRWSFAEPPAYKRFLHALGF